MGWTSRGRLLHRTDRENDVVVEIAGIKRLPEQQQCADVRQRRGKRTRDEAVLAWNPRQRADNASWRYFANRAVVIVAREYVARPVQSECIETVEACDVPGTVCCARDRSGTGKRGHDPVRAGQRDLVECA